MYIFFTVRWLVGRLRKSCELHCAPPPKKCTFYFLNNCQKLTDFNDFWAGMWNPEKIWQETLTDCPPRLSDVATLPWEIQKSHFQQYYSSVHHYWLLTLSHKKTICNPLAHPTWNVTTLTCELQNFFIWLKVCCVLSDIGGSKKSQLWVVFSGCEKNRLWCVATGMLGKQCHSKCSKWPRSALMHAYQSFSTLFGCIVHHAVLKFSPGHNKPLPQASTCPYQYTRSSCSVPRTQY